MTLFPKQRGQHQRNEPRGCPMTTGGMWTRVPVNYMHLYTQRDVDIHRKVVQIKSRRTAAASVHGAGSDSRHFKEQTNN